MNRFRSILTIIAVGFCVALVGCGGANQFGSQQQNNSGNSSVVLAMTDSPPSTVSILSAKVTLTGATLSPGNVSLFSGSTTVELTKLQTDIAYIATATNIPAGNYTSVTLTFANPSLTIENDTASPIGTCAVGLICTMAPTSTANLSTTQPLTSFTTSSSAPIGILADVNLENILSAMLGADFSAVTVTSFVPGANLGPPAGTPFVDAEDVVGQVQNINSATSTFTLTNALGSYSLKATSASTFFQFPSSASCATQAFSCLQNNQILSVDIGIQSDGSIYARNIVFEDADSSDIEVEGIVTSTNLASQQFNFVVLTTSSTATGLAIGMPATVQYSISPATPFDVDFVHADNQQISTSSFALSFTGPADLVAGQQVSIRRNSSSSSVLLADRVRLRSSRITGNVQKVGAPNIYLQDLPSLFLGHGGVTQIIAQTSAIPPTIYYSINGPINASTNILNLPVSVRGPLFNTGGTNRTLIATKVVLQQ